MSICSITGDARFNYMGLCPSEFSIVKVLFTLCN